MTACIWRYKETYREYIALLIAKEEEERALAMATGLEASEASLTKKIFKRAYPKASAKLLEDSRELFKATRLTDLMNL